jgi:hypothetical protein
MQELCGKEGIMPVTWVKELFEQLGKTADILNLGRVLFYTFAGALTVIPFYLVISLLLDFGHSGIDPLQTRQERAGAVRKLGEVW